ncbi:HIT family protein [Janibacter alittae]|uniref:HIT family protein n=1 Tax=Janibacter alittae TaxID=3115209 RepID=A0ABZ2MJU4_9MICO
MTTLFTKIITGEIPGRFVWSDETCVAFLTIDPMQDGHTMVVSREEIDRWTDADTATWAHLQHVAQIIGRAQQAEWDAPRVGMMVEGFEVPHLHVHLWPAYSHEDFDPRKVMTDLPDERFEAAAERLRSRLRTDGHAANVPGPGPLPA